MSALGTKVALAASTLVAPPVIWSLIATCRKIHAGSRRGCEYMFDRVPHICAMWHQRVLMIIPENGPRHPAAIVSRSKDGEIIARAMQRMGYVLARGSSSRGGREALGEMARRVREGRMAGFVADGPRGPARVAKIGAILAARETGTPVCGVTATATRSIFARSWDRTEIPLPFATIVYGYTEPFDVPRNASSEDLERMRQRLERELNEVDARCRELAGRV
jgi:lysophospholipid acyltransferase (LPLAT)-like uncharacterized protein